MSATYYNEIDPFAASWLRNLIAAGHLPAGDVDERSIVDVRGDDLRGYGACHFFAGIGGWPLALRRAGVPDEFPVWTGSCPCQPFSVAGKGGGTADERHLWPALCALVTERGPAIVFGEQVASAAGRLWLAGVRADLEHVGYAFGAADLAAASVGAPHIRQRLYWMAHAGQLPQGRGAGPGETSGGRPSGCAGGRGDDGGLGAPNGAGLAGEWAADAELAGPQRGDADRSGDRTPRGVGDALDSRLEGHAGDGDTGGEPGRLDQDTPRPAPSTGGGWDDFEYVSFPDGKIRRIESGLAPLASGIPGRVGRLRAYGNAICVPLATEFVMAGLEAIS